MVDGSSPKIYFGFLDSYLGIVGEENMNGEYYTQCDTRRFPESRWYSGVTNV